MTHTDTQDTHTAADPLYMHHAEGWVKPLSALLACDFIDEWEDAREDAREAYAEYHTAEETAAEYPDMPTPTQKEIIDEYIRAGYLIEVRATATDEEREEYGDWMDADK